MKIAVLGDIHGNLIALDAVLSDVEASGGVDAYWFLGDYCALGSNPVGVLERITTLPGAVFIRGNTDRYTTSRDLPLPQLEEVVGNADLIQLYAGMAANFAWTRGAITANGWFSWLKNLPLEYRTTVSTSAGQLKVLLVHATPGRDDGEGVNPLSDDQWLYETFGACDQDLIFVGHTHRAHERQLAGKHIINPGSVGNPATNLRAGYALLRVDAEYSVTLREVDYDVEAVINHIYSIAHPGEDYFLHFYRGQPMPEWYRRYLQQTK